MRTIFLTLIGILAMGNLASCMAGNDRDTTEERRVENYSAIEMDGVAQVYFTQAETYSLRITGSERLVKATRTEVRNHTLCIDQEKVKSNRGKISIFISAPRLDKVAFDGVGAFLCEERLDADDIRFEIDGVGKVSVADLHCRSLLVEMDGVGSADIHADCRDLTASLDGVGKMTLSGKAGRAEIHKDGVGVCDTRNLKIGKE